MIKAGIIGDDSLVCGELVRLLIGHPDVKLVSVASMSHAGVPVAAVHRALLGETKLSFVETPELDELDVLLVCGGPGDCSCWLEGRDLPQGLRIIDLTPDHRLSAEEYVYGLPELNRKHIVHDCMRVACPGDVAMAVMLAVLPLARNLMLVGEVNVTVMQGGGDGVAQVSTVSDHDQSAEVKQTITSIQSSFNHDLNILAIDGALSSGVLAVVSVESNVELGVLRMLYDEYYDDHNFTFVVDHQPDVMDVLGTGKCYLHLERTGRRLVITSVIDGMLKGAASNAVHCMNLMFGLQECTGLKVKDN